MEELQKNLKASLRTNKRKSSASALLGNTEKIQKDDTAEIKLKKIFRSIKKKTIVYKKLVVSEKNGPYKTINAALRAAKGPTMILVDTGLYNERIKIRKPDIKIMPSISSQTNDIIILNSYSSSIEIDIPKGTKCEIINLKITHTAKNDEMEEKQKNKKKLVNAFIGMKAEFLNYHEDDARGWKSNTVGIDESTPCLVRVKSGSLIMKVKKIQISNFLKKISSKI